MPEKSLLKENTSFLSKKHLFAQATTAFTFFFSQKKVNKNVCQLHHSLTHYFLYFETERTHCNQTALVH